MLTILGLARHHRGSIPPCKELLLTDSYQFNTLTSLCYLTGGTGTAGPPGSVQTFFEIYTAQKLQMMIFTNIVYELLKVNNHLQFPPSSEG